MRKILISAFLIFSFLMVFAGDINADFQKANKFYTEKKYNEALELYKKIEEKLKKESKHSFKLNYNLGCVYYRLNEIAPSRYYFEKAKKIKPFDKDLLKNISLIKKSLKDGEKEIQKGVFLKFYEKLYLSFSLNTLTLLSIFFFLMLFLYVAMFVSGRFDKKKMYYGMGITLFLFLLTSVMFYSRYKFTFAPKAIVFEKEADVFSEPNTSSTVLFKLHEGTKVSVEEELNGYSHISLPDGLNGWIDSRNIKEF